MVIVLKNGRKITLDWNALIFEYLEDYEGGLIALRDDLEKDNIRMYACNHVIYSIIASNYEEELTYRQAVSLVNVEDIVKIVDFMLENTQKMEFETEIKEVVNIYKKHYK